MEPGRILGRAVQLAAHRRRARGAEARRRHVAHDARALAPEDAAAPAAAALDGANARDRTAPAGACPVAREVRTLRDPAVVGGGRRAFAFGVLVAEREQRVAELVEEVGV